jgi:hypothetical protein
MPESSEAAESARRAVAPELPTGQRQVTLEQIGEVVRVRFQPVEAVGADEPFYLGRVMIAGRDEPVPVTLYERDGSQVLVRQVDPCDIDPPAVALFDGDEVRVMEAISHTGLHTNSEAGSTDGFLFAMRVVPVRVEGTTVYARTLRRGEVDDGRRVHLIPGGQLTFEEGSVVAELDHIDDQAEPTSSGYVPLTPVLWTWLSIGAHDEARTRFLLAAARRLDTANLLLIEVEERRGQLNQTELAGPAIRQNRFELVGCVEQAVISLGRGVDMVLKAKNQIRRDVPIPQVVADATEAVRHIRNAYEHIDDRAAGNVRGKPHPDALTIFDWERLLTENAIVYGNRRLELSEQVPALIAAMRQFFKSAAADG